MSGKNIFRILFPFLVFALLIGCATQKASPFVKAGDLNAKMKSGNYIQNADNFLVIVDKTGSMGNGYGGVEKFSIEKSLVSKFNSYIPDLPLNGGLRTLGQNYADFNVTKLEYGMTKYDGNSLDKAIQKLETPFGDSPLERAILAAGNDMKGLQGKSALVIFSDGVDMGDAPVKAATNVKKQYGDKLCIYTVLIGDDKQGAKVLDQIAKAGQCGVSVKGDSLADDTAMANFVERIFLAAKGAKVAKEKALQKEAPVFKEVSMSLLVEFDTGKSVVKPKYNGEIKKFAEYMKEHPKAKVAVKGHTDNVGGKKYNLNLSRKRAEAVKKIMVTKFKISADRIKTEGFGYSKPIASNSTKEGKMKNRRAEATVE